MDFDLSRHYATPQENPQQVTINFGLGNATLDLLAKLEDESTRKCVTAERAFLLGLGGGCAVPVAAYAETGRFSLAIRTAR